MNRQIEIESGIQFEVFGPRLAVFIFSILVGLFGWAEAHSAIDRSKLPEAYDELDGDELLLKLGIDGRIKELRELSRDVGFRHPDQTLALHARALLLEADGKPEEALKILAQAIPIAKSREQKLAVARDHLRLTIQSKQASLCDLSLSVLLSSPASPPLDLRLAASCYALSGVKGELRAVSFLDDEVKKNPALRFHPIILAERTRIWTNLGLIHVAEEELFEAVASSELKSASSPGFKTEVSGIVMDFLETVRNRKWGRPPFGEKLLARISHFEGIKDREAVLGLEAQRMYSLGKKVLTATRFEQLLAIQPDDANYAVVASALYRLMGWRVTAGHVAMLIGDPKVRLKLVGSNYLEDGQLAKIAALFPSLDRSLYGGDINQADTQEWIYLGAFARLQSGGWSERGSQSPMLWLRYVKQSDLREKATTLRNLVEDCRSGPEKVCEL